MIIKGFSMIGHEAWAAPGAGVRAGRRSASRIDT